MKATTVWLSRRVVLALLSCTLWSCTAPTVANADTNDQADAKKAASPLPSIALGELTPKTDFKETLPDALPPLRVNVLRAEGTAVENELRVAYLGSTVMERASVHGFLETELTRRWPDRNIIFRNLAWPGDTVQGHARYGFGPGEERQAGWQPPKGGIRDYGFRKMLGQIKQAEPDVLLVGYGSNVAFEGEDGVAKFRAGLERLLDALKPTGVRVILLTPPPREPRGPAFASMSGQEKQLAEVANVINAIGKQRKRLVVDVRRQMLQAQQNGTPITDNGIHLNEQGYRLWSRIIAERLAAAERDWSISLEATAPKVANAVGAHVEQLHNNRYGLRMLVRDDRLPSLLSSSANNRRVLRVAGLAPGSYALDIDGQRVAHGTAEQWAAGIAIKRGPQFDQAEQLREKIMEKNRHFFYGFRPQNETYIYLFRRHERGHHEGELSQFAAMAGRAEDAIARLRKPPTRFFELVREANYNQYSVPQKEVVPDIAHEIASFTVADDFEVNLFASDPMIANPININWDERGRMWVATSSIYPHLAPGQKPDDRIVILEDIDRDGRADKSTVYADELLVPHSAMPSAGGAYVTQSTDVLYLRDADGDGRADERQVIFTGFGNADMHHTLHSLRWGPGGDLYFQQGIYIHSHVETPWGVKNLHGSGLWRLRPELLKLDIISRGFVNPWGNAFDRWGQIFSTDGAGGGGIAYSFDGSAFTSAKGVSRIMRSLNPGRPKECGLEIASGRHLPESWQGHFVTADFRANQVVRYELTESGSGYRSRLVGNVLSSKHRSFRPVDVKMGPDGAIYVVDWYSPIIQHGEVDFHHPQRDRKHGRIWRLTAKNRPTLTPPNFADATTAELLDALKLPEMWSRDQARRMLREQGAEVVVPELKKWLAALDQADERFEHHRLEGLWVYQGLRHVEPAFLKTLLSSDDHRVRAAAVRVLLDWHTSIDDATSLLASAAQDAHPQVRLEAVNALRKIPSLESAVAALKVVDQPLDTSLEYATWLTARQLAPYWLPEMEKGNNVFGGDPSQTAFALTAIGGQASLKHIRDLIGKESTTDEQRGQMLAVLASEGGVTVLGMVVDEALRMTSQDSPQADGVLESLLRASRSGRGKPKNAAALVGLMSTDKPTRVALATELAGNWKIAESTPLLIEIAKNAAAPRKLRNTAAISLARIEGTGSGSNIRKLLQEGQPLTVRISAMAAWSLVDPVAAAPSVAEFLAAADAKQADAYASIFEQFLARQRADRKLAEALAGKQIPAAIAATGVRAAGESGRNVSGLIDALTKSGGLTPVTGLPTGEELSKLLASVEQADPHRGEAIFRRAELTCTQCHSIAGAGGKVGPDLSSLGGSVQPAKILEAILAPSANIKEGYQTVSLFGMDGRVTSGVVTQDSKGSVTLRDAKNRMIEFSRNEIDEIVPSQLSLMPEGLTQKLRQDELADLVSFLSQLGRPGDFAVPTKRYVRSWQALVDDEVSRKLVAAGKDVFAADSGTMWREVYSRVDGSLPLEELNTIRGDGKSYLRATLEANDADAALHLDSSNKTSDAASQAVVYKKLRDAGVPQVRLIIDRDKQHDPLRVSIGDK